MNINTTLNNQDYIKAYTSLFRFLYNQPLISTLLMSLTVMVSCIPASLFPLKMAALVALMGLGVTVVTTQYRHGSLHNVLTEFKFHQPLLLSVVAAVSVLSWGGYIVAGMLHAAAGAPITLTQAAASSLDGTVIAGVVILAAIVCVMQILPVVLSYFCNSLGLTQRQGETIWYKLFCQPKAFLAFLPIALLAPLAMVSTIDLSAIFVTLAALYSTFVFFIVFDITPAQPRKVVTLQMQTQS